MQRRHHHFGYQDSEKIYQAQKQKLKCKYVECMINAFTSFENLRDSDKVKEFLKQNRLVMDKLLGQIIELKQQNNQTSGRSSLAPSRLSTFSKNQHSKSAAKSQNLVYKEVQANKRLQRQYEKIDTQQDSELGSDYQETQKINQMNFQIVQLEREKLKLQKQASQIEKNLISFPFYKEWMMMCKQAEGAKHYNSRLKQQLQKKKLQLANKSKQ